MKILSRITSDVPFFKLFGDDILEFKQSSWKRIQLFHSADKARTYLTDSYTQLEIENPSAKAYDNCYSFIYYLEQGEIFYKQAAQTPLSIKPILLYYGLVHLVKACLLSVDPYYPHSTTVLAHGVSTRKRKRRDYQFLEDEVKIQKNGLCTYFLERMFHVKHLEGEKFKMGDLLQLVVEMDECFLFLNGMPNMIELPRVDAHSCLIPKQLLESYYMDKKRMKEYLAHKCGKEIQWVKDEGENITLRQSIGNTPPFRYHMEKQSLWLPANIHAFTYLPDLLIHYLVLYNLSMISRYETEWWMELIKTTPNSDYPFIRNFLDITELKGPFLIENFLNKTSKEVPYPKE
ncbi:YaaC family protein [Lederbergia sp. NSJ-179]|uniref:YaaC family protein n=1 Tax=Lederbergia sp. NSJ-179 TaxID=2931402 RepID=UPI001FD17DA7|nr:YaaC family protein [Lederbergia sp. NSJ-179]MCJ7842947.1 YaaC family protein [Lederbergia sp. NSJ-179]